MFRLLVTGSRNDPSLIMQERIKYALGFTAYKLCPEGGELKHGMATGVDTFCAGFWESLGFTHSFFATGFEYPGESGKAGGPIRNQRMVDSGADLCLAFTMPDSKGTWDCVRKARAAGITTFALKDYESVKNFQQWVICEAERIVIR